MVSSRLFSPQLPFRAEVVGNIWEGARSEAGEPSFWLFSGCGCQPLGRWSCVLQSPTNIQKQRFEEFLDLTSKSRFSQQLEGMSVP